MLLLMDNVLPSLILLESYKKLGTSDNDLPPVLPLHVVEVNNDPVENGIQCFPEPEREYILRVVPPADPCTSRASWCRPD